MAITLHIEGLSLKTKIGIYPWEKVVEQNIILDLKIPLNDQNVLEKDDISHTVDYDKVKATLETLLTEQQYELIETLAIKIADKLITEFKLPYLNLKLYKPGALKSAKAVGVILENYQKD